MIRIKVFKLGRRFYIFLCVLCIALLTVAYYTSFRTHPAIEVFNPYQPESSQSKSSGNIYIAIMERAFPVIKASVNHERERNSFIQGIMQIITGLDYSDPKTFILAQLPIIRNYNIPVSRGDTGEWDGRNPYDLEDLEEILDQYDPMSVDVKSVNSKPIEKPEKTRLEMDMPLVLIYHTHTSEAYRPSQKYNYTPTDVDRTIDPRYSVVRIGKELKEILESRYGIKVIHDTTFHDYPEYGTSYARSLNTIKKNLSRYTSLKILLDIHRDAFPMRNRGEIMVARQTSVMTVDGKNVARIMLVWGPDAENSSETRKFAELLKDKINQRVPGLCRKVHEKKRGRYNQHLSNYSTLIEVGSNANTMEEALNSVPYLAEAIAEVVKEIGE